MEVVCGPVDRRGRRRCGLSLVEVLVAIAVIGALLALLLPAVGRSREAARRAGCLNNIKQLGLALHSYHDTHRAFPPAGFRSNELSWHVHLLPFVEQQTLYNEFNFNEGSFLSPEVPNNKNFPHGLQKIPVYLCPTAPRERSNLPQRDSVMGEQPYTTHYYGVMGPRGPNVDGAEYRMSTLGPYAEQGLFAYDACRRFADITDGTSASFVVGEISWNDANCYRTWVRGTNGEPMSGAKNVMHLINEVFYAEPANYSNDGNAHGFNDVSFGSDHPGGTHVLMGDGGGRFVSETIDQFVYKGAASINGQETDVSLD